MDIRTILKEFRDELDNVMLRCMHCRVLLYGYESYTGRFVKWYAKYYHNIDMAYLVSTDMSRGRAYDMEVFRPSILDFEYRDVSDCVVWVVEPMTDETRSFLEKKEFVEDETYFDFYKKVYGDDICTTGDENADVYHKRKAGKRDIQFLEWLEWKYGCNFVTRIPQNEIRNLGEHNSGYGVTTQKEIFEILDKCHCRPQNEDAIFDFGCGKGGALVSFLDYGFVKVGGVEYDPEIFDILIDNVNRLSLDKSALVLVQGDAAEQREVLDHFNWLYFYLPFDDYIFNKCIENICESLRRKPRMIKLVLVSPASRKLVEERDTFRLTTQFTIDLRQRVVNVYESVL